MSNVVASFSALIQIEHHLRKSDSLAEFGFVITNELRQLVDYDLAVLLEGSGETRFKVITISDHASIDSTAPFVNWLETQLSKKSECRTSRDPIVLNPALWSKEEIKDLEDFFLGHLLWIPLVLPSGSETLQGGVLLSRNSQFSNKDTELLSHISKTAAHAMNCLSRKGCAGRWLSTGIKKRKVWFYAFLFLVLLSFLPVQLSVIAPAEVVAKSPLQMTSQLQGAIRHIEVTPGQRVDKGERLVIFDDTQQSSRYAIARKAWLKAKAELTTAQRGGFLNKTEKSKLAELQANVDLKEAEMVYAKELLQKTQLAAPDAGIVIMNDPKDWEGRPVQIGEKILSIANPKRFELEVQLPVKDFIVLNHKTPVRLFLDSDPLNPLDVQILYITYMPEVTPQGILAYKLVASFQSHEMSLESVRIGMRGTAKLYGESVTLFYYLFRRPITSVRQWLGW